MTESAAPAPTESGTPAPTPSPTPSPTPAPTPSPSPAPSPTPSPTPAPTPSPTPTSAWGENWRETYAGADAARLNVLKRYTDPKAVLDAHFSLKQRVDSGELKNVKPLAKDASAEQVTAWRAENGIPANAGDYLTNLPNGLVIGEADKPVMTAFAEALHKANAPPAIVHAALGWYNGFQEQQAADIVKAEKEAKQKGEDELRATWGPEYRTNLNLANDFLTSTAGDIAGDLSNAVLPDGSLLGDNPKVLQWIAKIAREVNPVGTLLPNSGGGNAASIDTRIGEIEKMMRTNRAAYNKDTKVQTEYQQLLDARIKMQARKAG
jgi:hypothetical protein